MRDALTKRFHRSFAALAAAARAAGAAESNSVQKARPAKPSGLEPADLQQARV